MIGRLVDGKGFEVLLDAVESLSFDDASLCILGDGPKHETLDSEIKNRGLTDHVFLTGYRDDVPSVLAASDVLVLPSFREGTPRVIIEAMACGLPVVATDIAGIPEQVEHGESGYLIPTGDSEALASRLDELLSNPTLREQMGKRGYGRAERFSIDTMLEKFDHLYQDLLTRPE
jgi:glycosyltransferase involved in cell wall biosynthesis